MKWHILNSSEQIDEIIATSMTKDIVIFKHSTSCSLSYIAKMRLEDQWSFDESELIPYYLDLKEYRNLSNEIAERFSVHHESPQILLIRKGECLYDASHLDITVAELKETLDWHTHA
jgi:bacillithiol system protein YtxJ